MKTGAKGQDSVRYCLPAVSSEQANLTASTMAWMLLVMQNQTLEGYLGKGN